MEIEKIHYVHIFVVLLVVLSTTAGVSAGAKMTSLPDSTHSIDDSSSVVYQQTAVNNSTVDRHQNPTNRSEQGDLSSVSLLLSDSLTTRLERSSVSISREEYEIANDYVGPEYRERLRRYVEVAGQTSTESDDNLADRLNQTSENQRQLTEQLEEFNETRQEYRQAKQAGNETRAEQLARELQQRADRLQGTSTRIVDEYRVISNETSVDLSEASIVLNQTIAQRLRETQEVQDQEFTATQLDIRTTTTDASFTEPVTISGRLTSNGSALANRSIQLDVGNQSLETQTDDRGNFTVEYRPVTQSLGTQQITFQYVPSNESNLQRSADSVTVIVTQVQPNVNLNLTPSEAEFNETVQITGDVTANGVDVPSAPLSVYLADELILTNETTREGEINESIQLSIRPPEGIQSVQIVVGAENESIGRGEASAPLDVNPAVATLTLNATRLNQSGTVYEQRTVITEGRLTTVNATPVAGQTIDLLVEGIVVGTVQTNNNGFYEATIEIPSRYLPRSVGSEDRIQITAEYTGEETNLEATSAAGNVLVQAELLAVIGRNFSLSETLLVSLVIGSSLFLRRRYGRSVSSEDDPSVDESTVGTTGDHAPSEIALSAVVSRLLDSNQPDAAVRFAYTSARQKLAEAYDIRNTSNATHWEFYRACRDASLSMDLDAFERLTALYERAAFDSRPVDTETANRAISTTEDLVDGSKPEKTDTDT